MKTCNSCSQVKDEEEFAWKNKSKGQRQLYCKACKKKYNQTWYSNPTNRQNQISRTTKNNKKYAERCLEWKLKYVADRGGCSWEGCDVVNPVMIDFDHTDPTQKIDCVSRMMSRKKPIEELEREADKCILLCANHHRLKTADQFSHKLLALFLAADALVSPQPPKL